MDTTSQPNPIEEDNTSQFQWHQQDGSNLDDSTTMRGIGLSDEARTRLEEFQTKLDNLMNEKATVNEQLGRVDNPALRVNLYFY